MVTFTITCNGCGTSVELTDKNVQDFVQPYAWACDDFKVSEDMPIGAFVTYDTSNETVLCKCGNKVRR